MMQRHKPPIQEVEFLEGKDVTFAESSLAFIHFDRLSAPPQTLRLRSGRKEGCRTISMSLFLLTERLVLSEAVGLACLKGIESRSGKGIKALRTYQKRVRENVICTPLEDWCERTIS